MGLTIVQLDGVPAVTVPPHADRLVAKRRTEFRLAGPDIRAASARVFRRRHRTGAAVAAEGKLELIAEAGVGQKHGFGFSAQLA